MSLIENSNNFPVTFSRASSQFTVKDGSLVEYAIDVPAFGDTGFSPHKASTNFITYSDDLTNAAWTKTNCTAAAGAPTTILGRACTKLTDSGAGGGYAEFAGLTGTVRPVFSVWLSCASGTKSVTISITDSAGSPNSESVAVTVTTTPQRVFVSTPTSSWTSPIAARITINDAGGEIFANLAQYETGGFATDELPTSGSTVARSASYSYYSVAGIPANDIAGSFTIRMPRADTQNTYLQFLGADNSNYYQVYIRTSAFLAQKKVGGSYKNGNFVSHSFTPDQEYLVTFTISSTTGFSVTIDGQTSSNADTADISTPIFACHPASSGTLTQPATGGGQFANFVIEAL